VEAVVGRQSAFFLSTGSRKSCRDSRLDADTFNEKKMFPACVNISAFKISSYDRNPFVDLSFFIFESMCFMISVRPIFCFFQKEKVICPFSLLFSHFSKAKSATSATFLWKAFFSNCREAHFVGRISL